ncbi:hypothetical protein SAMN05216499_1571, partial [Actinacidiphila paucisporea]
RPGGAGAGGQDSADPPAGNRPLLPFQLSRSQLGLDPISFLPQPVDTTASSELVLFQQSDN